MREAKSYRDPYNDIKRTAAMSGPFKPKNRYCWQRVVLTIIAIAGGWSALYFIMVALTK